MVFLFLFSYFTIFDIEIDIGILKRCNTIWDTTQCKF